MYSFHSDKLFFLVLISNTSALFQGMTYAHALGYVTSSDIHHQRI